MGRILFYGWAEIWIGIRIEIFRFCAIFDVSFVMNQLNVVGDEKYEKMSSKLVC